MLLYARIFVLCATLARIQKLQPTSSSSDMEIIDQNVLNLWQSLITTIMDQMAFLINEPAYRCQLPWAPTYPALTIAFVSKYFFLAKPYIGQSCSYTNSDFCTSHRTLAPEHDRSRSSARESGKDLRLLEAAALPGHPSHSLHLRELRTCSNCKPTLPKQ